MKTFEVSIESLIPYRLNAKTHPQAQIDKLADWIKRAGFLQPVVIDSKNEIIIGHGRTLAARQAGLSKVPCVKIDGLTEAEIRSLRLFDNKIADTPFDESLLKQEAIELANLDEFTIDLTGFDEPDFVKNLDKEHPLRLDFDAKQDAEQERADTVPDTEQNQFNVKRGQVWQLGEHRLMCGDSTSDKDVGHLMEGKKADMVFTDPPYGVNYDGSWRKICGTPGKNQKIKNDHIFPDFIKNINCDICYIWHADTLSLLLQKQLQDSSYEIKNQIIWRKPWSISKTYYNQVHEPCFYAVKTNANQKWIGPNNDTTVWELPDFRVSKERDGNHPMEKPTALAVHAISNHDVKTVLDLFGGSGSTLIACEKTGRKCYMMELDEHYCSVIINRWQEFTGKQATLIEGAR